MTENKEPGRRWVMSEHQGWGNQISVTRSEPGLVKVEFVGLTTPRAKVGDIIAVETVQKSNPDNKALTDFEIVEIRYPGDPSDMWFAVTVPLWHGLVKTDTNGQS